MASLFFDSRVSKTLERLGCSEFLETFVGERITFEDFQGLTKAELNGLLPNRLGPRKRIYKEILRLKGNNAENTSAAQSPELPPGRRLNSGYSNRIRPSGPRRVNVNSSLFALTPTGRTGTNAHTSSVFGRSPGNSSATTSVINSQVSPILQRAPEAIGSNTARRFLTIAELVQGTADHAIRFRVTVVGAIKSTRIGAALNFLGFDNTGEISFVAFGNKAEEVLNILKINAVYEIYNFKLEHNGKNEAGFIGDLQVNLKPNSVIISSQSGHGIRFIPWNPKPLAEFTNMRNRDLFDTIGKIVEVRSGPNSTKKDIIITDNSNVSVKLTLWNDEAETFSARINSFVLIWRANVNTLDDRSLNCGTRTLVWIIPDRSDISYIAWHQPIGLLELLSQ